MDKSCSACLKSQGIKLDNLKPYTPIPSLKTLFSLFQYRILKHKEGTYEPKLLVGNQLYDWYTHRWGQWCKKSWKNIAIFTYKRWLLSIDIKTKVVQHVPKISRHSHSLRKIHRHRNINRHSHIHSWCADFVKNIWQFLHLN